MFLAGIDYFIVECPTNGKKPYYNIKLLDQISIIINLVKHLM